MKRKTSNLPTRIYTYGCRAPTEGAGIIREQLWLAHRYYNDLIALERDRRAAYRELRAQYYPGLEELEAAARRYRETKNKSYKPTPGQRAQLKALREQARADSQPANAALKARIDAIGGGPRIREQTRSDAVADMLTEDWPDFWKRAQELDADVLAKQKRARAECGVPHGTYALVEERVRASCKASRGDPRYRRWDGSGRIGVQLAGGLEIPAEGPCVLADRRLQLSELPESQWDTRSGRRHAFAEATIRVGARNRESLYARFPTYVHRRPVGTIKWAWILARRVGVRMRYYLQLSLESERFLGLAHGGPMASINFGWRALDSGDLRVAMIREEHGSMREVRVPAGICNQLNFANRLKAICDLHFETAKRVLREHKGLLSSDVQERLQHMHTWRAHAKLHAALRGLASEQWEGWRAERIASGLDPFAALPLMREHTGSDADALLLFLAAWRWKDRHLYQWECDMRAKAICRRNETFRVLAAELCRTHATLLVEEFNISQVAQKRSDDDEQTKRARANRMQAAPGKLRAFIRAAAYSGQVQAQPCRHNTRRCAMCGEWLDGEPKRDVTLTCPQCSREQRQLVEIDQDENNCANQFERLGAA